MIATDQNNATLNIGDSVTYIQKDNKNTVIKGNIANIVTMAIVGGYRHKVDIKFNGGVGFKTIRVWADEVVKDEEKQVARNG